MTGRTVTPVPLSITRDGDTVTVTGSALDLALLRAIAELSTDNLALPLTQRVWGCDRYTARLLLRAAREGSEE